MKIYLGNLPRDLSDAQLNELVLPYGTPESAEVARDKGTGESRGFGFVQFADDAQANAAIAGLHGRELGGGVLKVNESRPRPRT